MTGILNDEIVQRAEARVGSVLQGKYQLDRLLGVGGMAAVYAATHRNGNKVAIKMLHPPYSADPDQRSRFLREGYVANAVEHSGAVRVLDDDIAEDGAVFVVMELLDGAGIDEVCDRFGGTLPSEIVLSIMAQLLQTIAAAHDKGIIHRDIKPDNVFLTNDGHVKLLDFGIARMATGSGSPNITRSGTTVGTPAFMAPEQALGKAKKIDALSDLYGVGAVMFTLLSGRCVHEGETLNEQLILAATEPALSLGDVSPHLPSPLVEMVDKALAFEKAKRWQSAEAMRDATAQVYEELFRSPPLAGPALAGVLNSDHLPAALIEGPDPDVATLTGIPSVPPPQPTSSPTAETIEETAVEDPSATDEIQEVDPEPEPIEEDMASSAKTSKWEPIHSGTLTLRSYGVSDTTRSRTASTRAGRVAALVGAAAGTAVLGLLLVTYVLGRPESPTTQLRGHTAFMLSRAPRAHAKMVMSSPTPLPAPAASGSAERGDDDGVIDVATLPPAPEPGSPGAGSNDHKPGSSGDTSKDGYDPFAHQ